MTTWHQEFGDALASLDRLEAEQVERAKPPVEQPRPATEGDELLAAVNAQTTIGTALSLDSGWLR